MRAAVRAQLEAAKRTEKPAAERTTPGSANHTPDQPKGRQKPKTEAAEKHVTLPAPPKETGPWRIGPFTVYRATTYPDTFRAVVQGPAEDFTKLLTHLQAFKP